MYRLNNNNLSSLEYLKDYAVNNCVVIYIFTFTLYSANSSVGTGRSVRHSAQLRALPRYQKK